MELAAALVMKTTHPSPRFRNRHNLKVSPLSFQNILLLDEESRCEGALVNIRAAASTQKQGL
jgi:hypothetical protein